MVDTGRGTVTDLHSGLQCTMNKICIIEVDEVIIIHHTDTDEDAYMDKTKRGGRKSGIFNFVKLTRIFFLDAPVVVNASLLINGTTCHPEDVCTSIVDLGCYNLFTRSFGMVYHIQNGVFREVDVVIQKQDIFTTVIQCHLSTLIIPSRYPVVHFISYIPEVDLIFFSQIYTLFQNLRAGRVIDNIESEPGVGLRIQTFEEIG